MFDVPVWVKLAVFSAILAGAVAVGHGWGAAGVQSDWDAAKVAAADAVKEDEKKALAVALAHEQEIAALRAQIRKNKKGVYDAVNASKYRGCVADNGLVGLWRESYLSQANAPK